ncbi:MAG TPA: MBL fold metallo-hydrolase [Anaeromyxobacteraceae bacterium]|nr:MBL fold metallo-hydrolase [Anaeromyxobacteraceae bacterium]
MSEALPGMPPPPPPARARPAAAVILWREGPEGRKVFWVRRGDGLRFAGGFHAFPGGRVDEEDAKVPVAGMEGADAAHVAAACRELFEEAGVLLARGAERIPAAVRDEARHALLDGRVGFAEILFQDALALDPTLLAPAGRWTTPEAFPVRFDARFYLARLPAGQEASVWPGELSGGEFVPVARALASWARGDALLHPPNWWGITAMHRAAPPAALELLRHPPDDLLIEFQGGIVLAGLRTPTLLPATHTNAWILELGPGGGMAVVDPGASDPAEQARLDRILAILAAEGRPAREVWLTHHHVDHVGGVAALAARGLPVRAHPETARRLPGGEGFLAVADGELLHGRWRALFTPGHAPGHLCFLDEKSGALVAGDMVSTLSTVVIDPPDGDMGLYLASLSRLRALPARTLYPAHGSPAPSATAKLDDYLAHRQMRAAKVEAALSPGGTLAEVTRVAYDDTPAPLLPVAERSCLATLLWLEREGRALRSGGIWGRP